MELLIIHSVGRRGDPDREASALIAPKSLHDPLIGRGSCVVGLVNDHETRLEIAESSRFGPSNRLDACDYDPGISRSSLAATFDSYMNPFILQTYSSMSLVEKFAPVRQYQCAHIVSSIEFANQRTKESGLSCACWHNHDNPLHAAIAASKNHRHRPVLIGPQHDGRWIQAQGRYVFREHLRREI